MLNPVRPTAGELDRARPLLRRASVIVPSDPDEPAGQGVGFLQQPRHYAHSVPEEAAVTWLMHERGRNRAVQSDDLAGLDLLLSRAGKHGSIDRFPRLRPDRADRLVQHRLLRGPRHRQSGEGGEGGGVLKMKRKLLIAQLTVLLEQPAAQYRLRRQSLPSRLLDAMPTQILRHQPN